MKDGYKRLLPIAAIIILQLVAVYSLALSLQRGLASQISRNAQVTLDDMTVGVVDRTRRFLRPAHDAVKIGIELMDQGVLDGSDNTALESYFKAQLDATPWLSGLFLGRTDGSFVYLARNEFGFRTKRISMDDNERLVELVQRNHGGEITESWFDIKDDYDPRTRSWYHEAQSVDAVSWTEPYLFFSSGLEGISTAARSQSGMTLGADVELQELSAFIEHIPHAENGTALIIDSSQNVIAHSGVEVLQSEAGISKMPMLSDIAQPPLLALNEASGNERSDGELIELTIDSRTYLGLAHDFPISKDAESWTLLVQMVADDYAEGALSFFNRHIILLGFISVVLGTLALGALYLLHRLGRRSELSSQQDPTSGALFQREFSASLRERVLQRQPGDGCDGVMVIEAIGLRRLADRHGEGCRTSAIAEIAHRLKLVMTAYDLLGISPNGRYFLALHEGSENLLRSRFDLIHEAVASNTIFLTPSGPQQLTIASGAAVLEEEGSVGNLLPRAKEALTIGIDQNSTTCQLAIGIDEYGLSETDKAA